MTETAAGGDVRKSDPFLAALLGVLLLAVFTLFKGPPTAPVMDAGIYVKLALGVSEFGTFGEYAGEDAPSQQELDVAPLYPAFLAGLIKLDPGFRESLICAVRGPPPPGGCPGHFRTLVIAQGFLAVMFLLSVWYAALLLSGRRAVAWAAYAFAAASVIPLHYTRLFLTEALILPLFGFFTLCLLKTLRQPGNKVWPILTGLMIALLALTKPIYAYLFWFLAFAALILVASVWRSRGAVVGLALFLAAYGAVTVPWAVRNYAEFGSSFASGSQYGARALAQRVAYNRMSAAEWSVAFVYWIPDFGDSLAEQLFPATAYEKLGWADSGYYFKGGSEIMARVFADADSENTHVGYLLRTEVLARPLKHVVVSLPLAWRGMFVAKYWGMVAWVCCVWLLWRNGRRREWDYALLCLPAFFLAAFYAGVSVSIRRYNITLIPVLSIAAAMAAVTLAHRIDCYRRKGP